MLQHASVTGLVRMILLILVIYFGIKILARLLMPFFVKYIVKKTEQRFGSQNQRQQEPPKKEGEITIEKMPKTKASNNDVGDYVDYEEID